MPKLTDILLIVAICFLLLFIVCLAANAEEWTDEALVNAIYMAEGGEKANYLYGIVSVPYDTPQEARQICLNTVRNQKLRHNDHKCGLEYLECLQRRYCPLGAENDPKGLNSNWLSNVSYFLKEK